MGRIAVISLKCYIYFYSNTNNSIKLILSGARKVLELYDENFENFTSVCQPELKYNFYYNAKIGQQAVLMPYAAYTLIAYIILFTIQESWFSQHKWRQWARILDVDKDGVISADDMEKQTLNLNGSAYL